MSALGFGSRQKLVPEALDIARRDSHSAGGFRGEERHELFARARFFRSDEQRPEHALSFPEDVVEIEKLRTRQPDPPKVRIFCARRLMRTDELTRPPRTRLPELTGSRGLQHEYAHARKLRRFPARKGSGLEHRALVEMPFQNSLEQALGSRIARVGIRHSGVGDGVDEPVMRRSVRLVDQELVPARHARRDEARRVPGLGGRIHVLELVPGLAVVADFDDRDVAHGRHALRREHAVGVQQPERRELAQQAHRRRDEARPHAEPERPAVPAPAHVGVPGKISESAQRVGGDERRRDPRAPKRKVVQAQRSRRFGVEQRQAQKSDDHVEVTEVSAKVDDQHQAENPRATDQSERAGYQRERCAGNLHPEQRKHAELERPERQPMRVPSDRRR